MMALCRLPWSLVYFASLLLLLGSFVPCTGSGRRRCTLDDYRAGAPKQGYICGKRIPQILSIVCGGSYGSPVKRDLSSYSSLQEDDSLHAVDWSELDTHALDEQEMDADPDLDSNIFVPRIAALSYLRHKRSTESNFRTGVYCECCVHQCGYGEVTAYCGNANTNRNKRHVSNATYRQQGLLSWWTNMIMKMFNNENKAFPSIP